MPLAIKTFCFFPNCSRKAEEGKYCFEHRKQRRKECFQDRAASDSTLVDRDRFYSSARWMRLRLWFISQHPLCNHCGQLAHHVDHIEPIVTGINPFLESNLQSLCVSCHSKKTRSE